LTVRVLDLSLVLFWTSLGISAAVVALFLWLMREDPARKEPASSAPDAPAAEDRGEVSPPL